MSKSEQHRWQFTARFRRNAFGWRSQPAIQRVQQAVSEIRKTGRRDPVLGAEGAVLFIEKISPALEHVDSSSGAIGTAVNHAIEELVPIIAKAPVELSQRARWLERLWEALMEDAVAYIEGLGDYWGELCAGERLASSWADNLGAAAAGSALIEYWRGRLGMAERLILETLTQAYPDTLTKEEVAAKAGYEANGGGFNNALGRLRTLELVQGRGEIKASDNLFDAG